MKNKNEGYFKGKNPYLLASFAIVLVSIGIIFILLHEKPPEDISEETVITEMVLETTEDMDADDDQSTGEFLEKQETSDAEVNVPDVTEVELKEEDSTKSTEAHVESRPLLPAESEKEAVEQEELDHVEQEPEITEPKEDVIKEPEENHEPEPEPEKTLEPEKHVHSWISESYYQEPTCSNGGLVNQICVHCGETQITGGVPTGNHEYKVEKAGDCCSAEIVVCVECNYRDVREKDVQNHIDVEDGFCYGCGHNAD